MKSRHNLIIKKAQTKRQRKLKKFITQINTGLALMAAGGALGYINQSNEALIEVQANDNLSPSSFLSLISGYAKDIAAENDLYASVMIAQAALESGWGNSTLSQAPNYNLFGIKGQYNGQSVRKDTLEDNGSGQYYQIQDDFRRYDNYGESLNDYASLLTGDNDPNNWRYSFYSGARVSNTNSYQDATSYLTGRYATDTQYANKLNNIINQNNLTQYDSRGNSSSGSVNADAGNGTSDNVSTNPAPQASGTYTVKAGDGLYRIAANHGMSLNQLKSLNGISSNLIHPGQVLKVSGASQGSTGSTGSNSESNNSTGSQASNSSQNPNVTTGANGGYSVKRGDSLYGIARSNGMSLSNLKAINGLSSNIIYPGQVLKVSGTGSAANNSNSSDNSQQTPVETGNASNINPAPSNNTGGYTVKPGDGLYRIAVNHGMSLSQLKALNGLSSDLIHPGQVLTVSGTAVSEPVSQEVYTPVSESAAVDSTPAPASEEVSTPVYSEPAETPAASAGTHTVQAGDTLYSIAKRNGVDVNQLVAKNNGSTNIYVGQVLTLN